MNKELIWNDEFTVGVKPIDTAHQSLFRELCYMEKQLILDEYKKYDCIETIKFLRDYTLNHFKAEEAYMISIKYPYYEMHRKLHDNMRNSTLPAMENMLREKDFSREAILEFCAVLDGWLRGHILIEDRAITGKAQSKYIRRENAALDIEETLDKEVTDFMHNLLNIDLKLTSKLYDGFHIDKAFMYEATFNNSQKVSMIVQHSMILYMVENMLGVAMPEINSNVIIAFSQLCNSLGKALLEIVYPDTVFELTDQKGTVNVDFDSKFSESVPLHSLMWKSAKGTLAITVDKI